ncbi:MAG TPA: hypothetical protein VH105_11645 [Burkholderiales bacterium]|jgi:hypothetical protein|nr:hypothetical protein [Burkholderiales bacterium]
MSVSRIQKRRLGYLAMVAVGGFLSFSALAADPAARQKYNSDVAFCKSGQSQQDYATCMREAGAALQQSSILHTAPGEVLAQNSEQRCDALQGEDQVACQARMEGLGRTEGSVAGGGVIREITIVETTTPQ